MYPTQIFAKYIPEQAFTVMDQVELSTYLGEAASGKMQDWERCHSDNSPYRQLAKWITAPFHVSISYAFNFVCKCSIASYL